MDINYQDILFSLQSRLSAIIKHSNQQQDFYRKYKDNLCVYNIADLVAHPHKKHLFPFRIIGYGSFSVVLKHPKISNVVFKIHSEDGFNVYAEYCKNLVKPFSLIHPVIYETVFACNKYGELFDEAVYITVMEELFELRRPICKTGELISYIQEIRDLCKYTTEHHKLISVDVKNNLMQRIDGQIVCPDPVAAIFPNIDSDPDSVDIY
ncbi:hypothetical protein [Tolumonas lignilytica]|uniref:hypothetical protein n=1 Tax=Tolumonas lignilytica TaxID=1283284 RepID=UPI000466161C|nr:hypothetical protein [Tolumonas lignilytica]